MLKAEDIMRKQVVMIGENRSAAHAIQLIKEHNTPELLVVDKVSDKPKKLRGVVGLNRLKRLSDNKMKMKDVMKVDVTKIPYDMSLVDVLNIRKEKNLKYNPVVDENENIVGIITDTSIINVLTDIVPEKEEY